MFGLGPVEMGVIALLALLLFGNKLPKLMRSLGSSIVEFKKGTQGLTDELEDVKKTVRTAAHEAEREVNGSLRDVQSNFNRVTDLGELTKGRRA